MPNDTSIMTGIIIIFVALGVLLPYVESAFGTTSSENNINDLIDSKTLTSEGNITDGTINCYPVLIAGAIQLICTDTDEDNVNALDVIGSISKMFFWTFGSVPFFIDLIIFIPLRLLLAFLIYRAVRSGAG